MKKIIFATLALVLVSSFSRAEEEAADRAPASEPAATASVVNDGSRLGPLDEGRMSQPSDTIANANAIGINCPTGNCFRNSSDTELTANTNPNQSVDTLGTPQGAGQ